jgi:hypothetical protein
MKPFQLDFRQGAGSAVALKIGYLHSNEVILQMNLQMGLSLIYLQRPSGIPDSEGIDAPHCYLRSTHKKEICYQTHGHQIETREIHSAEPRNVTRNKPSKSISPSIQLLFQTLGYIQFRLSQLQSI